MKKRLVSAVSIALLLVSTVLGGALSVRAEEATGEAPQEASLPHSN